MRSLTALNPAPRRSPDGFIRAGTLLAAIAALIVVPAYFSLRAASARSLRPNARAHSDSGNGLSYIDVPRTHWASRAVTELTRRKILIPSPDRRFDGEKPVTRYELALVLYRTVRALEASRTTGRETRDGHAAALWLRDHQYLTADSTVVTGNGATYVKPGEVTDSLAFVANRVLIHRASPEELKDFDGDEGG